MAKMPKHPRLFRRGGRYYHRAIVPLDIRDTYGKTEETFSLGTSDYSEAVRRLREAAARVDRQFADHRRWQAHKDRVDTIAEHWENTLGNSANAALSVPCPGISETRSIPVHASVTPNLPADRRRRSAQSSTDRTYRTACGQIARDLFALSRPEHPVPTASRPGCNTAVGGDDPVD